MTAVVATVLRNDVHISVTEMATDSAVTGLSVAIIFTVMGKSLLHLCKHRCQSAVSCHRCHSALSCHHYHTSVQSSVMALILSSLLQRCQFTSLKQ